MAPEPRAEPSFSEVVGGDGLLSVFESEAPVIAPGYEPVAHCPREYPSRPASRGVRQT